MNNITLAYASGDFEIIDFFNKTYPKRFFPSAEIWPTKESLMADHHLKSKDLAEILSLTKGTIPEILNYNKGLLKDTIRELSDYFIVSQEAFNRPYRLINEVNRHFRDGFVRTSLEVKR